MKKLSILIPTVVGREQKCKKLLDFINKQINEGGFADDIEVISLKDNKEISIGAKRQKLYEMAKGKYSWQIDDDDWIDMYSIKFIMEVIDDDVDCITFREKCIMGPRLTELSNFSLRYTEWANSFDGYSYVRTPFYKCVIKTVLCLQTGVKDMRYGEDHQFAKDIYDLLNTETHIERYIYIYQYHHEDHKKKYGIK